MPPGAETIDGKGLSVYPGMIDAGTNLGLAEITLAVAGSVDLTEVGNMNANTMAIKGTTPLSAHINSHALTASRRDDPLRRRHDRRSNRDHK